MYRNHIGGFYKAPEGRIVDHNEVRRAAMYEKPYYDPNDKEFITDEARKLVTTESLNFPDLKFLVTVLDVFSGI